MGWVMTGIPLGEYLRSMNACSESVRWAEGYGTDWPSAWTQCPRGDWMLWIAGMVAVDRKLLVLAACACARRALVHVPAGEDRPRLAIETAERWARGEAGFEEVRKAATAAWEAATEAASSAAYSSAAVASAAAEVAAGTVAEEVAEVAFAAAEVSSAWVVASSAWVVAENKAHADVVRKMIPVRVMLDLPLFGD